MKISDYYSELMKQSFNDSKGYNYTPLAIMLFLKANRFYFKTDLYILSQYIYRFYADNSIFAKQSSSVILKNINHYYVIDLTEYIREQLMIWMRNGNGVICFDGENVYIDESFSNLEESEISLLSKVIETMCIRKLDQMIEYDPSLPIYLKKTNINQMSYEKYIELLNKTNFPKRAFEEINYCPCCEETNMNELQPTHLKFDSDLDDPNNSIVLCKEHSKLYFNKFFVFDKNGKINIIIKDFALDNRMHLNSKLVKLKKKYLQE